MSTTKLTLAQKVANLNTPLTWDNIQNKPPFGTEANTILEGSKFIEGLGVNGYGGTIQDPGQKVAGKCYFDINTKSLFLCKTTNNLTSPNSDYFTSFDNKSLLNKLENLYRFEYKDMSGYPFTVLLFQRFGNIGFLHIDIGSNNAENLTSGQVLFKFPKGYVPKFFKLHLVTGFTSGVSNRIYFDPTTQNCIISYASKVKDSIYLNTSYIIDDTV